MMAKFLVTGGAGFIGSNTVIELVKRGHTVRVLDNLFSGKEENLSPVRDKIEFLKGSITDAATCAKACEGMDYVIHLAAIASVPRSVKEPLPSDEANVRGTLQMLIAAKDAGVKRLVYAGSSSAYGDQEAPVKSEDLVAMPKSPYAVSKYAGELYCKVFNDLYGLETVVLRYFNVFGPRQDPNSQYAAVIPKFITEMIADRSPVVFGDGKQTRDFTFVSNNVFANIAACTAPNAAGETVNIACGENIDLNALVAMMNKVLGTAIEPTYIEPRKGDVLHTLGNVDKAKRVLGYVPLVGMEEGIRLTAEWLKGTTKPA